MNMKKYILLSVTALCMLVFSPGAFAQKEVNFIIRDGINNSKVKRTMEASTSHLLTQLNRTEHADTIISLNASEMSAVAREDVQMLWGNEAILCPDHEVVRSCITTMDGYQVRAIPLVLFPRTGSEQVYQEAVINYDKKGLITSFRYTIDPEIYGGLVKNQLSNRKNQVTDLRQRQKILDYVEQFRTSYNKRDLAFLRQIFSDDALIITGTVITQRKSDVPLNEKGEEKRVVYKVKTKQQYLKDMERIFRTKSYIKVEFDSITISNHQNLPIYGVTVRQKWNTNNYSDEGWVFMLWDFRNKNPEIRVRTWQPLYLDEKRQQTLNKDDIFELGDFKF